MANDPFAFLRGSCHLFYQDYAAAGVQHRSPAAWICGDLHLENFGGYLSDPAGPGEKRRACFDLNDFGEALLAPASWELSRFLVSLRVAAQTLSLKPDAARHLCGIFLSAYGEALRTGKAAWVEEDSAKGMLGDLLQGLRKRSHADYLDERTQKKNGRRVLRLDGKKALPVDAADRARVERLIAQHADTQPEPKFFKLLDVARRIAGTGSLGIERYVLLVRGDGEEDGDNPSLLDLRHEPGSALAPNVDLPQPAWPNDATRVVELQRRMQAHTPAFLSALNQDTHSYVLRELLPHQDRLDLQKWNGKLGRLEKVIRTMGQVSAWAQLRAAGQEGAAEAAELIDYGAGLAECAAELFDHAETYAEQVERDWRVFAETHQP
jgi:uncharacterized protein (DUF2252 family)